jgi:hypothetical protein
MRVGLIVLTGLLMGCAGPGPLTQSCEEFGLSPGTPQYQKCQDAKASRQISGTRSAIDTLHAVDAIGMRK